MFKTGSLIFDSSKVIKFTAFLWAALLIQHKGLAQTDDIVRSIVLDSVVVNEVRKGFSVADFIAMVQRDTSFYHAFQNLRYLNYTAQNNIFMYDRDDEISASIVSTTQQHYKNNCRWMTFLEEEETGKFFKRNEDYKYYTAELFDFIFFTKDTICNQRPSPAASYYAGNRQSKHADMLKTLIFSPGTEVKGVPLIGNKLNLFDPEVAQDYDYSIRSVLYQDSIPCYEFEVVKKKGVDVNDVIINRLSTYFSKESFNVMARVYDSSYSTILFDFDVKIKVELTEFKDMIVPKKLQYTGYWDIPLKRPEISILESYFYNFSK